MRKVIALVMAIAVVTAFILPTATAQNDKYYSPGRCDAVIKVLNSDMPYPAKANLPAQFWDPIGTDAFRHYVVEENNEALGEFLTGMGKTYAQMMEWGVYGSWEPIPQDEDGDGLFLDEEYENASILWNEFGAWNAWEYGTWYSWEYGAWASWESGVWQSWEDAAEGGTLPVYTVPEEFKAEWNEWGTWYAWEAFEDKLGEPQGTEPSFP
jgi:hypothetical protein